MTLTNLIERLKFGQIVANYWVVFGVMTLLIIGLVLETSIVSISGFGEPHNSIKDVPTFGALTVICIVSQLIILYFVGLKIFTTKDSRVRITFKSVVPAEIGILIMLTILLLEVTVSVQYHLVLLEIIFLTSSITSACFMALLSYKFISWFRINKSWLTLIYLAASICLSLNAIIAIAYVLDELSYFNAYTGSPGIVYPQPFGGYMHHGGHGPVADIYTISSAMTFVLLWTGTVFLLRKRSGTIRYWIIMCVPLLYLLSQFQPLILNALLNYASTNPLLFNIFYAMMADVSKPVGGILFGLAFVLVGRKIQSEKVKGYMIISGIGVTLVVVSTQIQGLVTASFPPFGILTASLMGLSSYLIFLGVYSAAVSTSQDSKLRASIRKSVEKELSFVANIADAQMENTIVERVLKTSKTISQTMPKEMGITTSITDAEITEYIEEVLRETHRKKSS